MRCSLSTFLLGSILSLFVALNAYAVDSDIGVGVGVGESVEIQFCQKGSTPYSGCAAAELRKTADALGTPVAIYEYVRNNYEYALYHGARSGSINTFLGGRGNDVDLAATLIAMLRSQNIPARYVVGVVRAPAAQVMNWLEVKDPLLAYAILRNQGIQQVALAVNGQPLSRDELKTKLDNNTPLDASNLAQTTIEFEHAWVEALTPYANYRGVGESSTNCVSTPKRCNWTPLDPSFKQHETRSGTLDPYSQLSFDYAKYYNAIKTNDNSRRDKNPLEIYQEQVLSWLPQGKTLEDIPEFQGIIPEANGLLPASLPYEVISTVRRYSSVEDHDKAAIGPAAIEPKKWTKLLTATAVYAGAPFGVTVNLVEVQTKNLTYYYDTNRIKSLCFYLDGVIRGDCLVETGTGGDIYLNGVKVGLGSTFSLEVAMDGAPAPDSTGADQVIKASYDAVVGGYYLIATGGETSNWGQTHRAAQQLLAANREYRIVFNPGETACDSKTHMNCTPYVDSNGNGSWDAADTPLLNHRDAMSHLTGGLLQVAATQYYAKLREGFSALDRLNKVKSPIAGFLGVLSSTHEVEYIDGTAFSVLPGGLLIDMKGIFLGGSWRIDEPAKDSNKQFDLAGHIVSSLEHEIWQELTGYDAISTVRGIQVALADGVTLVNARKSPIDDNMLDAYPAFGFSIGVAPTGFSYKVFNLFDTQPAAWNNPTQGATFDLMLAQVSENMPELRLARSTYHGYVPCVQKQHDYIIQTIVQGNGHWLITGSFCDGTSVSDTASNMLIKLRENYLLYIDAINYFDVALGFQPSAYVYRANPPASNAQTTLQVQQIRDDLYLRDASKYWVEYLIPSLQTTIGSQNKFSVYIRKAYETSSGNLVQAVDDSNLIMATFAIQNNSQAPSGGGYVPAGGAILTQATSIPKVDATPSVLPTFDNAILTDKNTIAEANNHPIKTASTADPVSTVTGNNYHDETDLVIKGRAGLNYVFTRTYNSAPSSTGKNTAGLGYGWVHSYAMRLTSNNYGKCPNCSVPEADKDKTASITYTDERGGEHNFLLDKTTYPYRVTAPQGEFDVLALDSPSAGMHTLTFRNGVRYVFEATTSEDLKTTPGVTARLKQIVDPWNNQLNFGYDGNGRLWTVADNFGEAGRTGLKLVYDANGVTVSDWSERSWKYGVTDGKLTSYTDPMDKVHRYGYSGKNLLTQIYPPCRQCDPLNVAKVATTFDYYQNGRTFRYYNTLGNAETLDYDLYRKATRVTDPRGGIREYAYDSAGRLLKLTEPDGAVLQFAVNADGLRYRKTDGLGRPTQYSYRSDRSFASPSDIGGNVTREQDAKGFTVDTDYGPYDQVAKITDKTGAVTETTFHLSSDDECKLKNKPDTVKLWKLSHGGDDLSNVKLVSYCWHGDGTLKSQTDYLDPTDSNKTRVVSYYYKTAAHLDVEAVTMTGWVAATATMNDRDAVTVTRSFTYDTLGRKTEESLARLSAPGNSNTITLTTRYEYDKLDRVTVATDAVKNQLKTEYDDNGRVAKITGRYRKPDGTYDERILTTRRYDAADRLQSETTDLDGVVAVSTYAYDAAGNVASVKDAEGHTTYFEYDALNRKTATIDPNGYRSTTRYDLAGRPVAISNGNGETTTFAYDEIGRTTRIVDPLGYATTYTYNDDVATMGRTKCAIDANGAQSCTVYDELQRAIRTIDANGKITRMKYDLPGNLTAITDAAGKTTSMEYDGLGRLTQVTDPLGKSTVYQRDQAGNIWQSANRLGQTTTTTFDALNRPTQVVYADDIETLGYDIYGNLTTLGNGAASYTFGYDSRNRLISKTDRGKTMRFSYDKVGNLLTKTDYQGDVTRFTYDGANRRVAMQNPAYLAASYRHDGAGRVVSRILSNGAQTHYEYDKAGRLKLLTQRSAKDANDKGIIYSATSYSRDRVGNVLTQSDGNGVTTYGYDALYRLVSADYPDAANDERFEYDDVGNRTSHTQHGQRHAYEYWPNSNRVKAIHAGEMSGPVEKSFIFDDEGRLTQQNGQDAKTLSWDGKGRASVINGVSYRYDALNYRIGQSGGSLGAREYYLEGEHLEAEYAGANLQTRYFRGLSTDELLAGYSYVLGRWTPAIYHHDALMSVTGISSHNGVALQTRSYSAFGDRTVAATGGGDNRLSYTGRERDADSGLLYYRARYYDPSIGRFISEDPKGFEGSGVNWYAYVDNNPVNGNDPSGMCPSCVGAGTSALMGGAIRYVTSGGDWNEVFDSKAISMDVALGAVGAGLANKVNQLARLKDVPVSLGQKLAASGSTRIEQGTYLAESSAGKYVGQSGQITARLEKHTERLRFGSDTASAADDAIRLSVPGGRTSREVFEQRLLDAIGGKNAPGVLNRVNPIGEARRGLMGNATLGIVDDIFVPNIGNSISAAAGAGMGLLIHSNSGGAATGGFLLYPNKPNTNSIQSVYQK